MSDETRATDQTAKPGNGQGKTFVSHQAGFFDLVVEETLPPTQPDPQPTIQQAPQNVQTSYSKDTFGTSPTRIFSEIGLLLKNLQTDIDTLEDIKFKFLDRNFLNRARIVYATTPNFMDREFIEAFNSYCYLDESLQLKFDELEKWFFEIGPNISAESSSVMGKFKVNLEKMQTEFEQGRCTFQENLEAVMQDVAGKDPRFIDYMHNLRPTFAMPIVDSTFKSELDQIAKRIENKGSIFPRSIETKDKSFVHLDRRSGSSFNVIDRVVSWWRNASTKTRALAVGVVASVVATLGVGGTFAVAKAQGQETLGAETSTSQDAQPRIERAGFQSSIATSSSTTLPTTTPNVPTPSTTTTQDLPDQPVVPIPDPEVSSTSVVAPSQPNVPGANQPLGNDQAKEQPQGTQSISITG